MAGRDTIKQRIALDGAEDIQKQLAALGVSGQAAFDAIKKAADDLSKAQQLTGLSKAMADVKAKFADVGNATAAVRERFTAFTGSIGTLSGNIRKTVTDITALKVAVDAAAVAFLLFVRSGADAADQAGKAAQRLGLTVDAYSKLKFAADQNNISTDQFDTGITTLNRNLGKLAAEGLGKTATGFKSIGDSTNALKGTFENSGVEVIHLADAVQSTENATMGFATAFKILGVSITDTKGKIKDTPTLIRDLAAAVSKIPDGFEKSAALAAIFGKSAGPALIPLLNQGGKGLDDLYAKVTRLGIGFTDAQAEVGNKFMDTLGELTGAFDGLKNQVALVFAPALTTAFGKITDFLVENRAAVIAFAQAVSRQAAPLIRDLFNAFTGNDAAVANKEILELRDGMIQFGKDLATVAGGVASAFRLIQSVAGGIASAINGIFGSHIDSTVVLLGIAITNAVGGFRLLAGVLGVVWRSATLLWTTFTSAPAILEAVTGAFGGLVDLVGVFATVVAGVVGWPALIVAGIAAAIAAIAIFWPQITAGAKVAFGVISNLVEQGAAAIGNALSHIDLGAVWVALENAAAGTWSAIVSGAQGVGTAIGQALAGIGSAAAGAWSALVAGAEATWSAIVAAAAAVPGQIAAIFANIGSIIGTEVLGAFEAAIGGILSRIISIVNQIVSTVSSAIASLNSASSSQGSGGGGFAGGGQIRGPGSATSDSIPIWASNGEFMLQVRAVQKYGLAFLQALNEGRVSLGAIKGFAGGGLIDGISSAIGSIGQPRLAFAGGGAVAASAGRPVNLTIAMPGASETFSLVADEAVADKMNNFAARKRMRSPSRKPGWYKSR